MLNITDVSVMPLSKGKWDCIAICQFTVDNALTITGLKLYEKGNKHWLVFPKNAHNKKNMKYAHPVTDEVYANILDLIVSKYSEVLSKRQQSIESFEKEEVWYKENFGATATEDFMNQMDECIAQQNAAKIVNDLVNYEQMIATSAANTLENQINIVNVPVDNESAMKITDKILENTEDKQQCDNSDTILEVVNDNNFVSGGYYTTSGTTTTLEELAKAMDKPVIY